MKLRLLAISTLCLVPTVLFAQTPSADVKAGNEIMLKIAKLDFLRSITPLLLTKPQLMELLSTMAKCKAKELEIRDLDGKELKKLDDEITKNLDNAIQKGDYPDRDFQGRLVKVQEALLIRRRLATNEMVDMLWETVKKNLNEGQIAAMGGLLDPKVYDPAKLTSEDKARVYIRQVFLDGMAYELMNQLVKYAK